MSAIKESAYNYETGEYEFGHNATQQTFVEFSEISDSCTVVRNLRFVNKDNGEVFEVVEYRDGDIGAFAPDGSWGVIGFPNLAKAYLAAKTASSNSTRKQTRDNSNYFPDTLDF